MKYLKLFEDFDEDDEDKLSFEPIIKALLFKMGLLHDFADKDDDFDIADAIQAYAQDYNEDTPYIHYLKWTLEKAQYSPGMGGMNSDDLEGKARMFYDGLVDTDVFQAVLECPDRFETLNYIRINAPELFRGFSKYLGKDAIDNASNMGEMGY